MVYLNHFVKLCFVFSRPVLYGTMCVVKSTHRSIHNWQGRLTA